MVEPLPISHSKDMWTDMARLTEVTKRANKFCELFPKESYQINPYTKASLTYVTGKVGEKPPVRNFQEIPGYPRIKCLYDKAYTPPMKKCYLGGPETEYQRYGWFSKPLDPEDYDPRFVYSHRTPEFIKTEMKLKAYDRMIREIGQK